MKATVEVHDLNRKLICPQCGIKTLHQFEFNIRTIKSCINCGYVFSGYSVVDKRENAQSQPQSQPKPQPQPQPQPEQQSLRKVQND